MGRNSHGKALTLLIAAALLLTGCGTGKQAAPEAAKQASYLAIKDDAGRVVVLPHKPDKIVVLSTSFLDLLYAVDGKAAGRPNSKTSAVPQQARAVPEVGYVYNVSLEKVVALQPDLVIAVQGMHEKLVPVLESGNIPVVLLRFKTYDDTLAKIKLFGDIAGTPEKAQAVTRDMQARLKAITDKLPGRTTKIAILHATAKSVTVELDNSVAGSMAMMLKLHNVAAGAQPLEAGADTTPYSLEKLVESDPDMIFVVTMGDAAEVGKRMQADVASNPAWSSLRAVRDKKVAFLPSDLFLLNPGLRLPEAAEYMARQAYPEVYADGQ